MQTGRMCGWRIGSLRHPAFGLMTTLLAGAAGGASAATLSLEGTVLEGLANPRGLALDAEGWLYVAEAGSGGTGAQITGGDGAILSYGTTGAITRVRDGVRETVAAGLPSLAGDGGFGATGIHDLAILDGGIYTVQGFGGDPNQRDGLVAADPGAILLGQVGRLEGGTVTPVADIAALERDGGPDDEANSNPFGLTAGPGGLVVADAGGNDILTVGPDGGVAVAAVLPPAPNPLPFGPPVYQAVPTGIATAPDGTIAFGQLTGFPFPPGAANVFSLGVDGGVDTVAGGFTNLIDVAFGGDGSLYALEADSDSLLNPGTTGALFEVFADGTRALLFDGLESPTGLAVGPDGVFYVSTNGLSPSDGRVVALAPDLAPVPLPAGLPLLAAALAGLGVAARRRR